MRDRLTPTGINSDRIAKLYDEMANGYDDFYSDERAIAENYYVQKAIRGHIKFSLSTVCLSTLDVGCGTGLLPDILADELDPRFYLGIDISKGMLEVAKRKHPSYRFERIDYREFVGWYDNVICLFGGLSYVPIEEAVEFLSNVVASSGSFFVMLYAQGHSCRMSPQEDSDMTYPTSELEIRSAFSSCSSLEVSKVSKMPNNDEYLIVEGNAKWHTE